jgi:ankyrin repeat protein
MPSKPHLPQIKALPRRSSNLFDKVCKAQLLSDDMPDLGKLRLYLKGLSLTKEQINLSHPETRWTFLHHFANQGDVDLVAWGLQAGADHTAANAMGKTPLHLAAETNKPAVVITLLKGGADPNAKTLAGFTPLHLAVLNRHRMTVRSLLGNSMVPLDLYSDSVHGTPLELAKDLEIREMLQEYLHQGFLKSALESGSAIVPTPRSKRILRQRSLTSESSECASAAVPTPKSKKILLQPLLTRDFSGQSATLSLATPSNADLLQLKAIERQQQLKLNAL